MSIVFTIYYKGNTGEIVSYQQGEAIPPDHETPNGCKVLNLGGMVNIWDGTSFAVNMKVDPATLHLIPINPVQILTSNPPSSGNPMPIGGDPNAVVKVRE